MPEENLREEVRVLLRDQIETYERLEVLLLLHDQRESTWTINSVCERTKLPLETILDALAALATGGLFETSGAGLDALYRYAPAHLPLAHAVDLLRRAYDTQRLEVVKFMSANAIERMRSAAARTFADAFLIGKGKKP